MKIGTYVRLRSENNNIADVWNADVSHYSSYSVSPTVTGWLHPNWALPYFFVIYNFLTYGNSQTYTIGWLTKQFTALFKILYIYEYLHIYILWTMLQ